MQPPPPPQAKVVPLPDTAKNSLQSVNHETQNVARGRGISLQFIRHPHPQCRRCTIVRHRKKQHAVGQPSVTEYGQAGEFHTCNLSPTSPPPLLLPQVNYLHKQRNVEGEDATSINRGMHKKMLPP